MTSDPDCRGACLDAAREAGAAAAATVPASQPPPSAETARCLIDWRSFHTELQRAAVAATESGAPLSLLMLELVASPADRLEPHSETAGNLVGALAGLIKAAVGARGVLARYTEERLAVIMGETDLEEAIACAEGLGRSLAGQRCRHGDGVELAVSPAIGLAQFRDDESLHHLIQRAAEALGEARIDRRRTVVADRGVGACRPSCPSATARHPTPSMRSANAGRSEGSAT